MSLLLAIASSRRRSAGGLDSDVSAFVTATGATDTTAVNNLVVYLKAQSIWNDVRFFPFKSAQNIGTGTTVYGLGGWTTNDVTLVNGPTWGASGVAFDGTDDRAEVSLTGIESLSSVYFFDRQKPSAASSANLQRLGVLFVGNITGANYFLTNSATSTLSGETLSIGLLSGRRAGTSGITWGAGDDVHTVSYMAASGSAIWRSKTASSLSLTSGVQNFAPSQAGWTTDSILHINAYYNSGVYSVFYATTRVALLVCKASLTTPQREAITDYLDAL